MTIPTGKDRMFELLKELEDEGSRYMSFHVTTPLNKEIITVSSEFARRKCEYIDSVYDEQLEMKSNPHIQISSINIGDKTYISNVMQSDLRPQDNEEDTQIEGGYY